MVTRVYLIRCDALCFFVLPLNKNGVFGTISMRWEFVYANRPSAPCPHTAGT